MSRSAVILVSVFVVLVAANRGDAQPIVTPLVSVEKNLQGKSVTLSSKDLTPGAPVPWSVTMEVLHGGKQEGVRLLHVDNGKLKITLIPTRGLGVLAVEAGDLRLGWDSPVREVVHPKHVNLASRGGLGWLEGFNEWLVRCGLENNGQAGPDRLTNNVGDEVVIDLPLHGKIANIPAQEVAVIVDKSPPHRITIKGSVQERMLFGPKLELATELSTEPGSSTFQIRDVVINRGGQTQEFQMLYHANFGKPLLEKGARLVAPLSEVTPYNANAARDVKSYDTFREPTAGYVEQVYLLKPLGDKNGRTTIFLRNQAGDRGASMSYSLKQLPYLTLWKNTGAQPDGYVIGIEPGTNYPNRRQVERKHGRVPKLEAGQRYEMTIDFGVHLGKDDVTRVEESIAAIQGDRGTKLNAMPQKLE
jgi:hypothetical protein